MKINRVFTYMVVSIVLVIIAFILKSSNLVFFAGGLWYAILMEIMFDDNREVCNCGKEIQED